MFNFDLSIGIDYSGAETSGSRLKSLQIYAAQPGRLPEKQAGPARRQDGSPANWTRAEIAEWLIGLVREDVRFVAGIDHAFSFPQGYFDRYGLKSWPQFLDDFCRHWPTDREHVYVCFVRDGALTGKPGFENWPGPGQRAGKASEFRLCEQWTSSAKSVFQFDVQGQVATSSHAGIPWLKRIRDAVGDRMHFWPFDGWVPAAGKAVIAEVYPSIFRNRYERAGRASDEQDAYAVARWLSEAGARGLLPRYFELPLTLPERTRAEREGWILGVG